MFASLPRVSEVHDRLALVCFCYFLIYGRSTLPPYALRPRPCYPGYKKPCVHMYKLCTNVHFYPWLSQGSGSPAPPGGLPSVFGFWGVGPLPVDVEIWDVLPLAPNTTQPHNSSRAFV